MSLQELWQGLRRSLATLIIFLVVGIALAVAYLAVASKSYTSTTRVFVSATTDTGSLTQDSEGTTLVRNSMGSYVDLVTSPVVLNGVAQTLGISESSLQSKVTATNPLNTTLLDIAVRDGSAKQAKTYSDAVSAAAVPAIEALQSSAGNASTSPIRLTVVSPATVPTKPTTPDRSLDLVLGAIIGLGLGLAVAGGRGLFGTPAPVEPAPDPSVPTNNAARDEAPGVEVPTAASANLDAPADEQLDDRDGAPSPLTDEQVPTSGVEEDPTPTPVEALIAAPVHLDPVHTEPVHTEQLRTEPVPSASSEVGPDSSAQQLEVLRHDARRWLTAEADFLDDGAYNLPRAAPEDTEAEGFAYGDRGADERSGVGGWAHHPAAAGEWTEGRNRELHGDASEGLFDL